MEKTNLEKMVRGWFIGGFQPTAYETTEVEVGVKFYKQNDAEERHFHKIATEITCIISGRVKMNDEIFETGDIVTIQPGISTNFLALTDTTTVVVKIPGALHDKYLGGSNA